MPFGKLWEVFTIIRVAVPRTGWTTFCSPRPFRRILQEDPVGGPVRIRGSDRRLVGAGRVFPAALASPLPDAYIGSGSLAWIACAGMKYEPHV